MKEKGQSLFEVIIALAISAIVITALVSLVSNSIQNAAFARNKTLAANYAQEATECLRSQRDSSFDSFLANAAGICSPGAITLFTRNIILTSSISSGKTIIEADVSVSWTDSKGDHEVKSVTNFSDWRQR